MSTTTSTKLGLVLATPGTGEPVDLAVHVNGNLTKLETAIGATACTSATRPASPFLGQFIRETDTSRLYVHNGSSPASAGWFQIMTQASSFLQAPGGSTATQRLHLLSGSATANRAIAFRGSADTVDHFEIDYDGAMQWGTGSAALDTNLYRSAANTLKTDDAFIAAGGLTVGTRDVGKGLIAEVSSVTPQTTTFAEAVALTLPSATYPTGRAFRVEVEGGVNATTGQQGANFKLRKGTTTGGTLISEFYRIWCVTAGQVQNCSLSIKFGNTSGADITSQIVLTLQAIGVVTNTVQHFASADMTRRIAIYDIGPATDYTNLKLIS